MIFSLVKDDSIQDSFFETKTRLHFEVLDWLSVAFDSNDLESLVSKINESTVLPQRGTRIADVSPFVKKSR